MFQRPASFGSQLVVPVVARPLIERADPVRDKLDAVTSEALAKREERDGHATAGLERAQARLHFLNMFREAQESGGDSHGFVKRVDDEFKKYKNERRGQIDNPHARESLKGGFDALHQELRGKALRTEAKARLRERIVVVGKSIDDLVAAATSLPMNFASHYEAGRNGIERLGLPPKIAEAFGRRLVEIPQAALKALATQDPQAALEMVKRRSGAADPKYGLERNVVRVIGKQAEAEHRYRGSEKTSAEAAGVTRTIVDGKLAIGAAKRGEVSPSALAGWMAQRDKIGKGAARELTRDSGEAMRAIERKVKTSAMARNVLARGKKIDRTDADQVEGFNNHFEQASVGTSAQAGGADATLDQQSLQMARLAGVMPKKLADSIVARFKSDDARSTAEAAHLISELEHDDPELTKGLDTDVLRQAHSIISAAEGGIDWVEAARMVREIVDLPRSERERREQEFARIVNGGEVSKIIEDAFGVKIAGMAESVHGRMRSVGHDDEVHDQGEHKEARSSDRTGSAAGEMATSSGAELGWRDDSAAVLQEMWEGMFGGPIPKDAPIDPPEVATRNLELAQITKELQSFAYDPVQLNKGVPGWRPIVIFDNRTVEGYPEGDRMVRRNKKGFGGYIAYKKDSLDSAIVIKGAEVSALETADMLAGLTSGGEQVSEVAEDIYQQCKAEGTFERIVRGGRLLITGHSQGAPQAQLLALYLIVRAIQDKVLTEDQALKSIYARGFGGVGARNQIQVLRGPDGLPLAIPPRVLKDIDAITYLLTNDGARVFPEPYIGSVYLVSRPDPRSYKPDEVWAQPWIPGAQGHPRSAYRAADYSTARRDTSVRKGL
ncbi:MAG: hypothetical protein K8S25_11905 [Alphaproteobacteria bacterium]|nr:hypothetical protein [Alphaproteobacteria bacterium]